MTYGVIFSAYQTREYVSKALDAWIELRATATDFKVLICAVSVRFAGFDGDDDGTREILRYHLERGEIDHVFDGPDNIPESTARSLGLQWLTNRQEGNADMLIQWDADEVATVDQLRRIIAFTEANPFVAWFRVSYANVVFTPDQRLAEPFTPPRIHRVRIPGYCVHSFSGDNDIDYGGSITRDIRHQSGFPSMTIPASVALVAHWSWLNDSRSQSKQAYQWARWKTCSFTWDDSKGGLIFNPALPAPKVVQL